MKIYEMQKVGRWEPRETTEEENAYLSAWGKIKAYIKENFNHFNEEKRFDLPHHVYHKTALFVEPDGTAYIARGSHGWPFDDFVDNPHVGIDSGYGSVFLPDKKSHLSSVTYSIIKDVVDNWRELKNAIAELEDNIDWIKNFEA